MSDGTLRTLERRWKESGAIQDEARYLVEKVRVGELPQINLRLAAMCGCPPAVEAMGPGPTEIFILDWLKEFCSVAQAWYPEMVLRSAHAACWASTLTLLARWRNPWMPGEIGRVFQLTAYRLLGGTEPNPVDVITTIQQEMVETSHAAFTIFGAERAKDIATALQTLRYAAASYADKECAQAESHAVTSAAYCLRWAEGVIGTDGIYHALAMLVAPYLVYGEDRLLWWREEVRFLYRGLNLHVKNNDWWKDAVA